MFHNFIRSPFRFFFSRRLAISDISSVRALSLKRKDIKYMRVSILKATPRPPHISLLKRKVEKEKREKKYRAVKRTNLPSTRSVESLVASLFPNFFLSLFYVSNREHFYLLFNEDRPLWFLCVNELARRDCKIRINKCVFCRKINICQFN